MKQLNVFCEGQTEQGFCIQILQHHLFPQGDGVVHTLAVGEKDHPPLRTVLLRLNASRKSLPLYRASNTSTTAKNRPHQKGSSRSYLSTEEGRLRQGQISRNISESRKLAKNAHILECGFPGLIASNGKRSSIFLWWAYSVQSSTLNPHPHISK
jgi:hypothetical protein